MKRKTAVQAGSLFVIYAVMCGAMLNASNTSRTATFKGTPEQVFNTAAKVAQFNWHVTFLDRETRILSFSEMAANPDIACSVDVEDLQDGSVRVTLGMEGHSVATTVDWADEIASRFFKGIEAELSKQAKPPH